MGASTSQPQNEPYPPYAYPGFYPPPGPPNGAYASTASRKAHTASDGPPAYFPPLPYQHPVSYPVVLPNGQAGYYVYPQQIGPPPTQGTEAPPAPPQEPQPSLVATTNTGPTFPEPQVEPTAPSMPEPQVSMPEPAPAAGPVIPSPRMIAQALANTPPATTAAAADAAARREHSLPEPPRAVDIPPHLISGTAVTLQADAHHDRARERRRRSSPLQRPLPALPQDVYTTPSYAALAHGTYPAGWPDRPHDRRHNHEHDRRHDHEHPKKKRGGLLRSLSAAVTSEPRRTSSAPVGRAATLLAPPYAEQAWPLQRAASHFAGPPHAHGPPPRFVPQPPPPAPPPPPPPPVTFDPRSGLAAGSPHKVLYKKRLYPTAAHLLEAHRFLDTRPDIAERIRLASRVGDALALSARYGPHGSSGWERVMREKMDEVQYLKFRQHPELRAELLATGAAPLVFADRGDPFWGAGPRGDGANELGHSLVRVRERLLHGDTEEGRWSDVRAWLRVGSL